MKRQDSQEAFQKPARMQGNRKNSKFQAIPNGATHCLKNA